MTDEEKKRLTSDPDGLTTYEYIANHIGVPDLDIDWLTSNLINVDSNGQFTGSAARYLHAIDPQAFSANIAKLIEATIDKDREHRYLLPLMLGIYGEDCDSHAKEISAVDNNFRRIYKRLYPTSVL